MLTVSSKQGILFLYSPLLSASNYLPAPPAQGTGASALTDAKIHIFSKIGGFFSSSALHLTYFLYLCKVKHDANHP